MAKSTLAELRNQVRKGRIGSLPEVPASLAGTSMADAALPMVPPDVAESNAMAGCGLSFVRLDAGTAAGSSWPDGRSSRGCNHGGGDLVQYVD